MSPKKILDLKKIFVTDSKFSNSRKRIIIFCAAILKTLLNYFKDQYFSNHNKISGEVMIETINILDLQEFLQQSLNSVIAIKGLSYFVFSLKTLLNYSRN